MPQHVTDFPTSLGGATNLGSCGVAGIVSVFLSSYHRIIVL